MSPEQLPMLNATGAAVLLTLALAWVRLHHVGFGGFSPLSVVLSAVLGRAELVGAVTVTARARRAGGTGRASVR